MIRWLRNALRSSAVFAFNQVDRDRWVATQAARLTPGSRVLDIGAGSCPYRALFSHCDYQAQDFKGLQGEQLRSGTYGGIDYVCDATSIPVDAATFDAVICTEMIEHVPYPTQVIEEFSRILKPGGVLLLTAPLGSGIHQEPYHFYGGFTPYWYDKFLQEAGFEHIRIEANGGSFKFFGQESLRFIRTTFPLTLAAPIWVRALWSPVWIILLPVLGFLVPVIGHRLDRYDTERRFTVGYHVRAERER